MNFSSLWQSLRGKPANSSVNGVNGAASPGAQLLDQARTLARTGQTVAASELYWKIKPKHQTPVGLVEHAELLIEIGDYFAATSKADRALQLEPGNPRALAVQREVTRLEDAEERERERQRKSKSK